MAKLPNRRSNCIPNTLISPHVAPSPLPNSTIAFVKERYPCLQYLITICTGAGIAARAGVLDGKYATTNKRAWDETIALGPKVNWVAVARWVVDGNIWTSSGISADIDLTIAFLEAIYGNETATTIANTMEYERHTNSTDDPFAALYGRRTPVTQLIQMLRQQARPLKKKDEFAIL